MTTPHDVHVCPSADRRHWHVMQGGDVRSAHRTQRAAVKAARLLARRDHVELVVHGRDGQIRAKDSFGRESSVYDGGR